jgi:selenocysteine lyase/cysteine desulfurase
MAGDLGDLGQYRWRKIWLEPVFTHDMLGDVAKIHAPDLKRIPRSHICRSVQLRMSERHLFDIPDDVAYFNAAYYSPLLKESRRRLVESTEAKSHPWNRTTDSFFDDAETLRVLAAALFGGEADGYAIVPAASYGLSTAARAVEPRLESGDRILLMADEFPSNVLPWQRVAAETGAEIVTVRWPADGDWARATLPMIDARVKVVCASQCHWTNGARIDLAAIASAARANGSVLVVDATQSLGAMPLSMDEIRPDFLVAATYKWLLCPYGLALMYVAPEWRDARPLEEGWLARENARDFTSLANYSNRYMPGARRFDGGQTVNNNLPGAIAALRQFQSWGIDNISRSLAAINTTIVRELEPLGFQVPPESQRCPHMFGAALPQGAPDSLVADLRAQKIYISRRGSSLRFSPHLYNDDRDVARLIGALGSFAARR